MRGRDLHGRLAAGVFAGQPGDEPCAGSVAGGAGGARAGAGDLSRSDPGRASDPEPGRGRGGQATAPGVSAVSRPAGGSGEAGGAGKAEKPSPTAGSCVEGADAGFEPGSLERRRAGRRAPPGGDGAGSAAIRDRETNIKDYYVSGKNSLVYSEEGRGQ